MEFYTKETEDEVQKMIYSKMMPLEDNNKPSPLVIRQEEVKIRFKLFLGNIEKKYLHEMKKPFCSACARNEFKDLIESRIRQRERQTGFVMKPVDFSVIEKDMGDLNRFGDGSYFEFIKDSFRCRWAAKIV